MKTFFRLLLLTTLTASMTSAIDVKTAHSQIKFKSDLRYRYQLEKKETTVNRVRNRIRFRLAGSSQISEETKVKFGLATGGTDPRSTNQTLQNSFQTPDIRLDYAFVKHKLSDQWTVSGGKMKHPFWNPSDLLWDTDINPDGAVVKYNHDTGDLHWDVSAGYFVLDELSSTTNDPYLFAFQPTVKMKLDEKTQAQAALTYYLSQNAKGAFLDQSANSNTVDSSGLTKEFSTIVLSGQIDFKDALGLPLIRPFGEILMNSNFSSNNKGGIVGVKLGDAKLTNFGQWQTKVSYRYLAANAWFDNFPDSDAYGGATNTQGLELGFNFALSKSAYLALDYYSVDMISGTKNKQDLFQIDLNIKL